MAAHVVVEFPISEAKTVFTGSAAEDTAYLKIFWKSIHLNPTIESRLVSSDVRQRVASLPLKTHEKQSFTYKEPDPPKLTEYHRNVFRLESEDQHKKHMELLDRRQSDLIRHKRRHDQREKVQESAKQRSIKADTYPILPPITPDYNDDLDPELEAEMEAKQAAFDIDIFEQQLTDKNQGKLPVDEHSIVLD